jgi:hypothetical protein
VAAALVCVVLLGASCSDSGTTELSNDSADATTAGPPPTAPGGDGAATGATTPGAEVDVNELIRRIDDLNNETDLCTLLTGQALSDVSRSNVNLTSLLSNPTGFTQLFTSLDKLFAHMVTIAPTQVQPDLQTMQGVWKGMSTIDTRSSNAETQAGALIADPKVQQAQASLTSWVGTSCSGTTPG